MPPYKSPKVSRFFVLCKPEWKANTYKQLLSAVLLDMLMIFLLHPCLRALKERRDAEVSPVHARADGEPMVSRRWKGGMLKYSRGPIVSFEGKGGCRCLAYKFAGRW
jgi:hypothetical protein